MNPIPTVADCMTTELVVVPPEMGVLEAMQVLLDHKISGVPVVDGAGHLIGILSERDCLRVAFRSCYHQDLGGKVAEYMTREVETFEADTDLVTAVQRFLQSRYRRFPVVEGTRVIGQVSRRDVMRKLLSLW